MTFFVATFADGHVETRNSGRKYTHAWRYRCEKIGSDESWTRCGFSRSQQQCEANQAYEAAWLVKRPELYRVTLLPIVAVTTR